MKIVHVVHSYYPKVGGIEKVVQFLAEEQAKLGHEVTVVTSNSSVVSSPKMEIVNNVKILRLKSLKLFYNDLMLPLEEPSIESIDVVHVHSQTSMFNVTVAQKLKKKTSKIIFYFMAVDAFKNHPNLFLRFFAPFYGKIYTKKAIKMSDLYLVRSLRDAQILMNKYNVVASFLPDGVFRHYTILP